MAERKKTTKAAEVLNVADTVEISDATEAVEVSNVAECTEIVTAPAVAAGQRKVAVTLPKEMNGSKNQTLFVSINDKKWMIKRGVSVEVPECVADVIRNMEDMTEISAAYIEENS